MKEKLKKYLKQSEKYTKTDMLYATKGSFWVVVGRGITALVSIALMAAFANWLPQEGFGTYQFILSVVSILAIISLPGISTALTRSIAKGKEGSLISAFKTQMKWGNLGMACVMLVAGWYFLNGNNTLGLSFLAAAIFFPLRNAANLFTAYWNGRKKFDTDTKHRVMSATASALILVATLYVTDNIILIILAFFGGQSLTDYFFYRIAKKEIRNDEVDQEVVPYGKSLTIMSIASKISEHIDKIILWKFLGPVQVAIYSFSLLPINRLKAMVPISALALPKLSEKDLDNQTKKGVLDKFWRLMVVMVPITLLAIWVAPFGYEIIFPQYMESVIYAQALCLIFLTLPFSLLGTALLAEMKKKELYAIKFTAPAVQTALLFALIPFYGVAGAVGAVIAGKFLQGGMEFYHFLKM